MKIQPNKPCIDCAHTGPDSYPRCSRCQIELLKSWINPKNGHDFSDASKDMMRKEIKELKKATQTP